MDQELLDNMNEYFYVDAEEKSILDAEGFIFDTNLSEEEITKYEKGMLIRERSPLILHKKYNAVNGNVRFYVYSNHLDVNNLDKVIFETCDNYYTITNTRYLVLDICKEKEVVQITLLHLPDQHLWTAFRERDYLDKCNDIISESRKLFLEDINKLPALTGNEHRFIGFENKEKRNLDLSLAKDMIPLKELRYRDYASWGRIYIESDNGKKIIQEMMDDDSVDFDGFICLCRVDHEEGTLFIVQALCKVDFDNNKLHSEYFFKEDYPVLYYSMVKDALVFDASDDILEGITLEEALKFYDDMGRLPGVSKGVRDTRNIAHFDDFRYINHPDAVRVLFKKGDGSFIVFSVLLEGISYKDDDIKIYGKISPNNDENELKDYGLIKGDSVELAFEVFKSDEGKPLFCIVYVGKVTFEA